MISLGLTIFTLMLDEGSKSIVLLFSKLVLRKVIAS